MKIVFKRAWRQYRVGDVIEPAGLMRDHLIGQGFCEPYAGVVVPDKPDDKPAKKKTRTRKPKPEAVKPADPEDVDHGIDTDD